MRRHLVARLGQSLIVVFLVTTISFFVIHLAPGDAFSFMGEGITLATRNQLRELFGHNRPLGEQYVRYISALFHGELGWSYARNRAVSELLGTAVPRTLLLAGLALVGSFAVGIVFGVMQAVRRGRWFDRVSSGVLLFFYSLPDFWAALMILFIFAHWWRVLPSAGMFDVSTYDYRTTWGKVLDVATHLILPLSAFVLLTTAHVARFQRAAMLEVLPADYVRTAYAKGVTNTRVIWHHAWRTALAPIITNFGLMLPGFLGGAVFIERVFGWPGLGSLAAEAVLNRDYFLVTATVIVGSVLVVIGNLVADVLQMALDPRVRE